MDLTLVQKFKSLLHEQFDELLVSQIEQYKDELVKLNENLEQVACMIKEKESLISDLQKQVDDNTFEESNFTNVSMIQNLTKQIKELSSKNNLLEKSLKLRQEADKAAGHSNQVLVEEEAHVAEEEAHVAEEEENNVVEQEALVTEEEENNTLEDKAENNTAEENNNIVEEEAENNTAEEDDEEEEEVEVLEIEHEGKNYYVQNQEIFVKKKDGSMGKKVGTMEGENVVIKTKSKKDKKDKKDKKKKKKN